MTTSAVAVLAGIRVVPVVVIDDAARTADLAAALSSGGISCAEITLRTNASLAALSAAATVPGFTVGAGTVITVEQVDRCADAGAQFIVSPGFDPEVVGRARDRGLAVLPGVATATEVQRAVRAGLEAVKFFPADSLGGLPTIAALSGPFPDLRFMPSGGVSASNAAEYLAHPAVFAVGGSWIASRAAIVAGDFAGIARLATEASALVTA